MRSNLEHDFHKIIAFPTLSQLVIIVVNVSLGGPEFIC